MRAKFGTIDHVSHHMRVSSKNMEQTYCNRYFNFCKLKNLSFYCSWSDKASNEENLKSDLRWGFTFSTPPFLKINITNGSCQCVLNDSIKKYWILQEKQASDCINGWMFTEWIDEKIIFILYLGNYIKIFKLKIASNFI